MTRNSSHLTLARCALGLAALAMAGCAAAQYKIVRADGSVTYADRPPPSAAGVRISRLGSTAAEPALEPALPRELQQAVQRYPVTFYATSDCAPCDSARQFLQRRGIPYRERHIAGDEDVQAFEAALGARTVPALTIGAQRLRGWSESDWSAYLDAAGYPRESRLPRGWQAPPATPLVAQRPAATPAPPAEAAPALDTPPAAPAPTGLRF